MQRKYYSAFTLIEMLIVMAILMVLITMGFAGGRYAINKAHNVEHMGAVNQLADALQAYYTDNRQYYVPTGSNDTFNGSLTALSDYLDSGNWSGGSDAKYYYVVDSPTSPQAYLVCVSLGGDGLDGSGVGSIYCDGNGFNSLPASGTDAVKKNTITSNDDGYTKLTGLSASDTVIISIWDGQTQAWN